MGRIVLLAFIACVVWLIRRDNRANPEASAALWIPVIWVGIELSRPMSFWLGFGGGSSTLEGSPLDSATYALLIFLALKTLAKRRLSWGAVIQANWPVFLLYGYLLLTVLWSDHTFVSTKRWFKEFGNVIVVLVILTEAAPDRALRTVFIRCAYITIPLSVITIRYFPGIGRFYNMHSGEMEAVGITDQKNALGAMVLVCGIVLAWEWLERLRTSRPGDNHLWNRKHLPLILLALGVWLLQMCNSKTSIICFVFAMTVLFSLRFRGVRDSIAGLVPFILAITVGLLALDEMFGLKASFLNFVGRNETLTGRTDVWREVLAVGTDPIFGTGFCSFWDNRYYLDRLPEWVRTSAHNAYLELYLDGGMIAVVLVILLLVMTAIRIHKHLRASHGSTYAVVRFVSLFVIAVAGFSESTFARMGASAFLFLATAIEPRRKASPVRQEVNEGRWREIPVRV